MRCCASPTTSTAPERTSTREVAAQFDALLLASALKPVAAALGFYGELVVGNVTQSVARAEHGGLTDRLESAIEASAQAGR